MNIQGFLKDSEVEFKIELALLFLMTMFCSSGIFFVLLYTGVAPWESLTLTWVLGIIWGLVSYVSYFILALLYWLPDLENECSPVYHPKIDTAIRWITLEGHPLIRAIPNIVYPFLLFVLFLFWFINWGIESDVATAENRIREKFRSNFKK